MELLVVVAVIALLVAILFPALRSIGGAGTRTVELSAARQLVTAYSSYTFDHDGALMPGYGLGLPAQDQSGHPITSPVASGRYPWRLAPYLDYNFDGLYLDPNLTEVLQSQSSSMVNYFLSLYPSLGINSIFLGGDSELGHPYAATQGEFWLKRLSQARHPADLLVFASARTNESWGAGSPSLIEGFHKVIPPYITQRIWTPQWDSSAPAADWGFVSMRHEKNTTVVGLLDGSADIFDQGEIQDMRHWADKADSPNWTLP